MNKHELVSHNLREIVMIVGEKRVFIKRHPEYDIYSSHPRDLRYIVKEDGRSERVWSIQKLVEKLTLFFENALLVHYKECDVNRIRGLFTYVGAPFPASVASVDILEDIVKKGIIVSQEGSTSLVLPKNSISCIAWYMSKKSSKSADWDLIEKGEKCLFDVLKLMDLVHFFDKLYDKYYVEDEDENNDE